MHEAVERPAWRISFRHLVVVALGLAVVAFIAGRYVYTRYGNYRPLALAHVPQTIRYRARVSLKDPPRLAELAPVFAALDPRATRLADWERRLGLSARDVGREIAFGLGENASDFVIVFGLQPQSEGVGAVTRALCDVLVADGLGAAPTGDGCRLADGTIVAGTADGAVLVASRAELVKDVLKTPELGDRLGFSGPSARGAAPELVDLKREARALAARISTRYP